MLCSRCKKRIAVVFITRMDGEKSVNEGICLQCAKDLNIKQVTDMVDKMGITDEQIELMGNEMMAVMGDNKPDNEEDDQDFETGGTASFPFLDGIFGKQDDTQKVDNDSVKEGKTGSKNKKDPKRKFIDNYCTNLTQKAKIGKIDNIIGREREIYRVIQILCRRTKNNPCLIGEPGVGKTAIAEGLALKIVRGDVPARLADKEIFLLDLALLVAGTQFRGQFESRLKGLIEEVVKAENIVLFIDEVHNLVGTGDAEGSMNAANILKPALSRGELQVIGATTFVEYRKYIEKDAALERRFQSVTVEELSIADTIKVIEGIKCYYEEYHHLKLSDGMINKIVNLSERYITDRYLPDKAIDLLDEACSCASLRNKAASDLFEVNRKQKKLALEREELEQKAEADSTQAEELFARIASIKAEECRLIGQAEALQIEADKARVTDDDVAKVIELWTGIPASKVKEMELRRLGTLEQKLKEKIIGQDEAVRAVSASIRRSRVQISNQRRPASFIFVGPTGVGKTELVKVLAGELFDTPETLIRLDMSEFMEKHSVSRIIGAPPGYVGYDEAGQLTEKVRRKPYSVILLDEIEKAHPDVLNILLQILDDGRITDAHGRTVNFENTVIIMTSNAGSELKGEQVGFNRLPETMAKEKVMKSLSDIMRPEFLSRIDEIVIFKPLSSEDFISICGLMMNEIKISMDEKGIELSWSDDLFNLLVKKAFGGKHGARDLRRTIRREIEDKLANIMVDNCEEPPTKISLFVKDDMVEGVCG